MAEPREILSSVLPDWAGPSASFREHIARVHALADSRFLEEAGLLALLPGSDGAVPAQSDARAAEIVAYARFLRQTSRFADEFYRLAALGHGGDVEDFRKGIMNEAEELWPHLVWGDEPVPLSWESLSEVLAPKFGTVYIQPWAHLGVPESAHGPQGRR